MPHDNDCLTPAAAPTLSSIMAQVQQAETVARGRGSPACDHLAGRLASIRGELQQIAEPQPGADAHAAQVLAAHNEWRRFNGETGVPGAPQQGDPAELGRALDYVVSRLRSQPPAEAQAVAKLVNRVDSDGGKTTTFIRPTSLGMDLPLGEYPLHLHTPPSAPVGVDVLEARLEAAERANEALRIDVAEAHNVRRQVQEKNRELSAALAQQPAAREAEPKLDAHDPASGELVAQWLFRNDLRELAAVVRAQLDMRAQQPAAVDEAVATASDRDLLKMVASATGLTWRKDIEEERAAKNVFGLWITNPDGSLGNTAWNPLHSGSDAFYLAVSLGISVCVRGDAAATRRAIVHAALGAQQGGAK